MKLLKRDKTKPRPNGKLLWDNLNQEEKDILTQHMTKEANREIEINLDRIWKDIEKYLLQSMKNNRISKERADKIINDTNNLVDRVHNVKVIDTDPMDNYIVLSKDEFSDLIEYAAINCENCSGIEGCKLYDIQHNQKVPKLDGSFKCKFSYVLNRRKIG